VGYSRDGGQTWALPGGPYGLPDGRNFLPTYLQEYADGQITGQPYYYASSAVNAERAMVFGNVRHSWVIRALGAYTPKDGSGKLSLTVDGREVASAPVSGSGMLRASISPVTVTVGQVVRVTATGLPIQDVVADTAWGRLVGLHLASKPWFVDGEPNFSHAAPVYALPAYGTPDSEPSPDPPPADPPPSVDPPPVSPPPVVTPPAVTPPPVVTPPVTLPPVTTPEVTPAVVTPPVVTPPVVTPPPVTPPVVRPPVVTPPPTTPAPRACRKRASRRPRLQQRSGRTGCGRRRAHRASARERSKAHRLATYLRR
jgi:hypothetical protein